MPAKKQTKTKAKKAVKADIVEESKEEEIKTSDSNDSDQPTSVEAAYWQQKVGDSTPKQAEDDDALAKNVEDYTSNIMVVAKPNETSEQLLRRFNREVRDLNLMDEIRDRLEYEKPSQRRKREKRERAVNLKRYRNE